MASVYLRATKIFMARICIRRLTPRKGLLGRRARLQMYEPTGGYVRLR